MGRVDRALVLDAANQALREWLGRGFDAVRGLSLDAAGALGSLAAAEVIAHWGPRPMTELKALAESKGLTLA